MVSRQINETEMRALVLKAALPAWVSVVVLAGLFHALGWPAYLTMGACFVIAVMVQSVLQVRVLGAPRPRRYWILSGALAAVGASASAWIAFR